MAIFMVFRAEAAQKTVQQDRGRRAPRSMLRVYRKVQENLVHGLVDGLRGVIEHPAGDVGERRPTPDDGVIRPRDQIDGERRGGDGLDVAVIAAPAPRSTPRLPRAPAPGSPTAPAPSPTHAKGGARPALHPV